MADDVPTSSGSNSFQVELLSSPTPTTTSVMTVTLRSEDVQAIVSGLAANPSALAAVALMMQSDGQQDLPESPNRSQAGKFTSVDTNHRMSPLIRHLLSILLPSHRKGVKYRKSQSLRGRLRKNLGRGTICCAWRKGLFVVLAEGGMVS